MYITSHYERKKTLRNRIQLFALKTKQNKKAATAAAATAVRNKKVIIIRPASVYYVHKNWRIHFAWQIAIFIYMWIIHISVSFRIVYRQMYRARKNFHRFGIHLVDIVWMIFCFTFLTRGIVIIIIPCRDVCEIFLGLNTTAMEYLPFQQAVHKIKLWW